MSALYLQGYDISKKLLIIFDGNFHNFFLTGMIGIRLRYLVLLHNTISESILPSSLSNLPENSIAV